MLKTNMNRRAGNAMWVLAVYVNNCRKKEKFGRLKVGGDACIRIVREDLMGKGK